MSNPIQLASYYQTLQASATLHINEQVKQFWRDGKTVYHLGFGESRFPVHPRLEQALGEHAGAKSYLPGAGLPELRRAVAGYYSDQLGLRIEPRQVLIGPGSKALIYALQMAIAGPLYLPSPSWVSYAPQAQMLGKPVHWIPAHPDDHYALDLAAFEAMLNADPGPQKLLIINTPNNPTGAVLSGENLSRLADLCRQHDVVVLSDEIYFRITHPGFEHRSIAAEYPQRSVILGGISKHLSLGGWRIGVAVLPDTDEGHRLSAAVTAVASETWSAVSAPVQHAACVAYSGDREIEDYIDLCTRLHALRTRFLHRRLIELGITSTPPQGGFYLTVNFDRWADELSALGIRDSTSLAQHLLERFAVATLPGEPFGLPPAMLSLRLAASYLDMETDEDAQRILDLGSAGIDDELFMSRQHHPKMHASLDALEQFVTGLSQS